MKIEKKEIGEEKPVFIIAELSANHNQNYNLAVKTLKAAKNAGADAIKLQTFTPDTITLSSDKKYFQIKHGTLWDGKTLYDLYKQAYMPWEWQPKLKKIADELDLILFSSPFDPTAVDFLETMKVPAYKVASPEITDIPLIEYIASKRKPVFISTGIATLADIKEAVNACRRKGNSQIALLKCTSAYPTPMNEVNLRVIPDLAKKFKVTIGLSDHTIGSTVPLAAVALGARIVEKHFILDRTLGGIDASFSLEPDEFKTMVKAIRDVEQSLGTITYDLTDKMKKSREFMRSLFVVESVHKGELLTKKNIRSIRPGYGLPPKELKKVLGKKAKNDIEKGMPLTWNLIEK
jgi:pseudaminic acid synthase